MSPRLCAKPLRDACKHLLHRITFCFLISPLLKPPSFIFYRSSLHSETQFCPFAPTFGCLALFAAAQWTDLQAPRLFCLRFVWYAGGEESNYSQSIHSPDVLHMPTHTETHINPWMRTYFSLSRMSVYWHQSTLYVSAFACVHVSLIKSWACATAACIRVCVLCACVCVSMYFCFWVASAPSASISCC